MIRITRKRLILAMLALFLLGVGFFTWTIAGLPPVKYYLRYGLDPYCEPTGDKATYGGIEFIEIGPGIFRMGSHYLAEGGDWLGKICAPFGLPWGTRPKPSNEMPVHWVEFRQGFWVSRTEITNLQYERLVSVRVRSNGSTSDHGPVAEVNWYDARAFCERMTEAHGIPFRLPSEAEWECACRAGSLGEFCFGDGVERLVQLAWYGGNGEPCAQEVGTKMANSWGLFDMHGNVFEWCEDSYLPDYSAIPKLDRAGVSGSHGYGVIRGGAWSGRSEHCRSSVRSAISRNTLDCRVGFRIVFTGPVAMD